MPDTTAGVPVSIQRRARRAGIAALHGALLQAAMLLSATPLVSAAGAPAPARQILFGAAYYEEYAPYDRLDADITMMKAAHINVVRIGESTWGTMEPAPGVYDFSHLDRVLRAMEKAGISVIVGTPTYAIPTWLARQHPDVLVSTSKGKALYGPRQNMDITHPEFLAAAERTIRAMITHVKDSPAVIGYQLDNETKSYDVSGPRAQAGFVAAMRSRFGSLDTLNKAFGLDYWSNRINAWEDFPSTDGAINASLSSAYAEYQRALVTDYLAWQASIVRQIKRPDQFVTQNFDMDWRGYSFGIQSAVDHFAAARALDIVGIDIYHKTQDELTGAEIAFGGDLARSMKGGRNYLVIETQAQGFPDWTPYPGQLRLQAFSHLASGANMLGYWHWGTTSNAIETYWRGLLAQDYLPNPTYREAATIGADLARLGPKLVDLKKHNRVAIYFSNRALTAYDTFRFGGSYNDVLRPFYDALYRMNVEMDFVDPSVEDLSAYKVIVVPALYAASDAELRRLATFASNGGHLVVTFRSGFSDENVKVRSGPQPGLLAELTGARYSQFTLPKNVALRGEMPGLDGGDRAVRWWMELLTPTTATVLAWYDHPEWGDYAAITRNTYGTGEVTYIGCMPSDAIVSAVLGQAIVRAGLKGPAQSLRWPIVARSGVNAQGSIIHYLLNYSARPQPVGYPFGSGTDLLTTSPVAAGSTLSLQPWGVAIIEEAR